MLSRDQKRQSVATFEEKQKRTQCIIVALPSFVHCMRIQNLMVSMHQVTINMTPTGLTWLGTVISRERANEVLLGTIQLQK